ncbi:hypothetical protein C8F04DRAFT_969939 [Mycena alexandri]|uniref:RNase H type-1 domain-containing protein n=1 Tax=Mycena alexandri TaxID=1745969 RepID=A0AAD6WQR9_9AGAR|nr:hypothetical protein C8F04DRAFT_969939 [Mycena alexandri]
MTRNLEKWENEGFFRTSNGPLMQATAAKLRSRKAPTTFKWVKGHSGVLGNEGADRMVAEGCAKTQPDLIDLQIDKSFLLPGAKLKCLTQSLAYKIIRQKKMDEPQYQELLDRRATSRNMTHAQAAAANTDGSAPPGSRIWNSIRHEDIPKNIRFFLWMIIHDGYKVGKYRENIAGFEDRGQCSVCEDTESMEHILTKCEAPGQKEIWDLVSEIWKKKSGSELRPSMGEIMACGATRRGPPQKKPEAGMTRFYRILVSESAHLIWRLRNERVIQETGPADINEIRNWWLKALNDKLGLDCLLTNTNRYGSKAISVSLQYWY